MLRGAHFGQIGGIDLDRGLYFEMTSYLVLSLLGMPCGSPFPLLLSSGPVTECSSSEIAIKARAQTSPKGNSVGDLQRGRHKGVALIGSDLF